MALMSDYQKRQLRDTELRRFDRWFVDTPIGSAYRSRDGRGRAVKAEEVARWRADVEVHVDAMIAGVPLQVAWGIGALFAIVFGGGWLLDALDIASRFHAPAIGIGVFIVEAGLFGIEIWDYAAGWRRRRDAIEQAVRVRAPLPIEPARLGSGRNWFQMASLALVVPVILLAYASHLDEGLIERFDWRWVFAAIPFAWGLHFAGKWYDGRIKELRR